MSVILEQVIYSISMVSYRETYLVEKLWVLSEKFCFKLIPDKGCPVRIRIDLFRIRLWIRILRKVSDPTPDPDPQHWFKHFCFFKVLNIEHYIGH
jgi:hypothetical protein